MAIGGGGADRRVSVVNPEKLRSLALRKTTAPSWNSILFPSVIFEGMPSVSDPQFHGSGAWKLAHAKTSVIVL